MLDDTILEAGMDILEGRFKVMKKLGSGAFGEIYKGKPYSIFKINIFDIHSFMYSRKEKIWGSFRSKDSK